jgi:glycosyltransferase involved in cell wall biosynthesis
MKFTIITPNYNGEKYLEKCIISVLDQKVAFEHIVVDAESTDSSSDILKKYPHLIIITEKDNGMYDAINKGIAIAKGDIIAYLNCDDRYPVGSLSIVLESFKKNEDIDYVYGNCRFIDRFEQEVYIYRVPPLFSNLLGKVTVIPWAQPSVFYKKRVFDSLGVFSSLYSLAADYHFMKRLIFSELKGQKINKVLSCFMKRVDALSVKNSNEMIDEVNMIKEELGHKNMPFLDLCFNVYRKLYNFQTFFKNAK